MSHVNYCWYISTMIKISRQEWNEAFAPGIWMNIQQHNAAKDPYLKKKLKETIKRTLYKWSDLPPSMVSQGILDEFKARGLDKNPFEMTYPDRHYLGYYKDTRKTFMLWEHTTPLKDLHIQLVKCGSIDEVLSTLQGYSGVCWITREEDMALNSAGWRSSRPGGWLECYESLGIKIVRNF